MDLANASHTAFSDESYYKHERFRSLAVVTFETSRMLTLSEKIGSLLRESQIRELKWNKLRQARERFAAIKVIDETISWAALNHLRVDVLIWDTEDSRHQVQGRDDIANLQVMYYHLFRNVLHKRWPSKSVWQLFPDENSALDWPALQDYLEMDSVTITGTSDLFNSIPFGIQLSQEFQISRIEEVSSEKEAICQIADLFAGVGAFSHAAFDAYTQWLNARNGQLPLGMDSQDVPTLTNSKRERFHIMEHLDKKCKDHKFRVSLRNSRGFKTYDPKFPINFWTYIPQHPGDKAPHN